MKDARGWGNEARKLCNDELGIRVLPVVLKRHPSATLMARLHRVSEFVAHTGVVNCVHLGPKKGGVLATGGDDRKINIWRVSSSPTQVMSLGGLTTPVTAVRFDWLEECVVGGTEGGTILLYDLAHGAKPARRLNSHKTA